MRSPQRIEADLAETLRRAFPDRDFDGPITSETRVIAELGLASIELVVLAEKLEGYYGIRLQFGPFLKSLRDRGADDLTVGELVAFLQQHVPNTN